jgi:hypothetical protein
MENRDFFIENAGKKVGKRVIRMASAEYKLADKVQEVRLVYLECKFTCLPGVIACYRRT